MNQKRGRRIRRRTRGISRKGKHNKKKQSKKRRTNR